MLYLAQYCGEQQENWTLGGIGGSVAAGGGGIALGGKGLAMGAEGAAFSAGGIFAGGFGLAALVLFASQAWMWDTWEDILYDLEYVVDENFT